MKNRLFSIVVAALVLLVASNAMAQKIAYINSQAVLAQYQEAKDAQERLDKINKEWEAELREMQAQLQEMGQQLESQSLLLSEERQAEKQQELQALYLKAQQFQAEKWGQNGEFFRKQDEIMKPVIDKINAAIKQIGEEDRYDFIFDTVAGNILYASPDQTDLTEIVLEELEKGLDSKK